MRTNKVYINQLITKPKSPVDRHRADHKTLKARAKSEELRAHSLLVCDFRSEIAG